jgi:hypothetical protein
MQQDARLRQVVEQLGLDPSLAARLPSREAAMVRSAMEGRTVYEIASELEVSEAAVWQVLGNAARQAAGVAIHPVESGGLGSDTEPGVTGGYGATGFGGMEAGPDGPEHPEVSDGPRPEEG